MKIATALLVSIFIGCSLQQETTEENVETTTAQNEEGEEEEGLQSDDPNFVAFYLYPSVEWAW